jgi:hypothetical protein
MSWSIGLIGKPENLVKALKAESERLKDQSKEEFDAALPHMIGLIELNVSENPVPMKLEASGHGYIEDGKKKYQTCSCAVNPLGSVLV